MKYNYDTLAMEQVGSCYKYDDATNDFINLVSSKATIVENMSSKELITDQKSIILDERTEELETFLFTQMLEDSRGEMTDSLASSVIHKMTKMLEHSLKLAKGGYKAIMPAAKKKGVPPADIKKLDGRYGDFIGAIKTAHDHVSKINGKKDKQMQAAGKMVKALGSNTKTALAAIVKLGKQLNKWIMRVWFSVKNHKSVNKEDLDFGKDLVAKLRKI